MLFFGVGAAAHFTRAYRQLRLQLIGRWLGKSRMTLSYAPRVIGLLILPQRSRPPLCCCLLFHVESRAVEPQVAVLVFLVVAQTTHGFLRSVDQALLASLCGVVAATEAAVVSGFSLGQQDMFLLKWTACVGGGVKRFGVERRSTGASNQGSAFGRI